MIHRKISVQPYIIRQGDFLALLAYRFNFDADAIWNDPANDDLRKVRSNPNILLPTDVLYIPDDELRKPKRQGLKLGQTNTFVSSAPTMTLTHAFVSGDPNVYASRDFVVPELEGFSATTSPDGQVSIDVPITQETVTVVFTDTGEAWELGVGSLDPINTPAGIFERLQNLGYVGGGFSFDSNDLAADGGGTEGMTDPSEAWASDDVPDGDSEDDVGLSDDGTLDDATADLLLKAYGC